MSEGGFTYETAIHDGMSGPAHHEVAALGELEHAIGKTEKALGGLASAHEHAGKMSGEAKGFLKEFTGSLVPEIAIGEVAAEGIIKLGESFAELGEKIVDFGIEGVKFSLEAAEFKENMVEAFTIVSGTAEEGEATYAAIERMSVASHLNVGKSASLAKELALSGLENVGALESTVSAIGALQRTGLDAGAEKLKHLIEQSEAAGHLILPKKLGAVGFNMHDLAKGLGETPEALKKDLAAGKISVERGIAAIDDAINHGKVGQLAAKKFDLTDVATDWANVWKRLTEDVDAGPLTGALRNFVGIFDEGAASGRGMKDEIVSDVNTIIRWLGTGVQDVETFALEIELGFLKGKNAARPLLNEIETLGLQTPTLETLGTDVQWLAEELTKGAISAGALVAALIRIQQFLPSVGAEALHTGGYTSAESFVGGIADGMTGGKGQIVDAVAELGAAAVEALRKVWDSHSPSRVAFAIGEGIPEGMALGADSGADRAAAAVGDALSPPDFSGGDAPKVGARSMTVTIEAGAIVVHGVGGESAHEMAELTLEQLTDVLRRAVQELGG